MALRHPIAVPADAFEGLAFCLSALVAHYPNRFENEISGSFPWTHERLGDGLGGAMLRSRVAIAQLQGRDAGKSWNFVNNAEYPLISLLPSYPANASFAITNSRDFLRLAIYFAKACCAHYGEQKMAVAYPVTDSETGAIRSVRDSLFFVNWTEAQLADGRPYCTINLNLPLTQLNDGLNTWAALNLASLKTPAPTLLPAFTAVA